MPKHTSSVYREAWRGCRKSASERRADFRFVRLKFLVRTLNEDRREGSRKSGEGSELIPKQRMRAAGEADPGRTVGEAAASRAAGEPAVLARPNPARLVDPPRCRCACPHRRCHAVRSPMRMPRAAGEADPGRAVGEAAASRAAGEPAVLLRPTLQLTPSDSHSHPLSVTPTHSHSRRRGRRFPGRRRAASRAAGEVRFCIGAPAARHLLLGGTQQDIDSVVAIDRTGWVGVGWVGFPCTHFAAELPHTARGPAQWSAGMLGVQEGAVFVPNVCGLWPCRHTRAQGNSPDFAICHNFC